MKNFLNDAWVSILNALCKFPNELFSSDPNRAMVAWTLLFTITTPAIVFVYTIVEGRKSSKIQAAHLEVSKSSAAAAKSATEQSFVQGLETTLDYDSALKYFKEISDWDESPLKELGIRRLRMQTSVPLPGNIGSVEHPERLTDEVWKDYKDSFSERLQDNNIRFLGELSKFLHSYQDVVVGKNYEDAAKYIFGNSELNYSDELMVAVKELFNKNPKIIEPALTYSLNWRSGADKVDSIRLATESLAEIFEADLNNNLSEISSSLSQPIADFLNSQSYRNLPKLGFLNNQEFLRVATSLVYLAGKSEKNHGGHEDVDHLKKRMIQGIPYLFKAFDFDVFRKESYLSFVETNNILDRWIEGSKLLKKDEPSVWSEEWERLEPVDCSLKSLKGTS